MSLDPFRQSRYRVRCEWGAEGIAAIASDADVVVIVDVLSFSTCVAVAAECGAIVHPCVWKDERAGAIAEQIGATLAVKRGEAGPSLSPPSLHSLSSGERLLLPSPNGSTLTTLAPPNATVIAGCLRNATAVAQAVEKIDGTVAVIPAGERWTHTDTLRPALEDLLGAGAIIDKLSGVRSPEAESAATLWRAMRGSISSVLAGCGSGRELIERGFESDLHIASEVDAGDVVPVLHNGAYHP